MTSISRILAVFMVASALLAATSRAGELAAALEDGGLSRAGALKQGGDDADRRASCTLRLLQNHADDAAACFRARLTRSPGDRNLLSGLAQALLRNGHIAEAADLYKRLGNAAREAQCRALAAGPVDIVTPVGQQAVIPFVSKDPLPILRVVLPDGKPHHFVLDTGAAETVLDPDAASPLGVVLTGKSDSGIFAGGRHAPVSYGILPSMTVGSLHVSRVPVVLLPMNGISAALGQTLDGILGVDVLRRFVATIDYPGSRLILGNAAPDDGSAHVAPMWLAGDHFLLAEATLNGRPELALLDTGLAGLGCTVPASTFAHLDVKTGERGTGTGGGGSVTTAAFTAHRIDIGSASQTDVPCVYGPFPPALEYSTGTRIGLLVSHAFLAHYAVTFDFPRMRLLLRDGSATRPGLPPSGRSQR